MTNGVYRAKGTDHAPKGVAIDLRQPVFEAFAKALKFPKWFGHNWDALEDCLTDWSGVLVIRHAQPGDELGTLIDVLGTVAQYSQERGKPFVAVFVDPDGKVGLPEVRG